MTLSGENRDEGPSFFEWDRKQPGEALDGPVTVFTDMCLDEVLLSKSPTNVVILIEPPAFSITHYEKAVKLEGHFDAIFTHELDWLQAGIARGAPWYFYPFGGSWIRDWHVYEKLHFVSLIVSPKQVTEGHRLRHEIAQRFSPFVDVWGALEDSQPRFEPKHKALRHYRYSIVVESGRADYWFTEKLIDCLSQGTVPIYWGCPGIDVFFDEDGIIPFEGVDDLEGVLRRIGTQDYYDRLPAIMSNLRLARGFRCAEDWMYLNHKELFVR